MSEWLEVTEERDDDVPAALAPFVFMAIDHVEQARTFLKQRTGASVADFDLHFGFIYMRWSARRQVDVYPWDSGCLERLSGEERRAVTTVWDQMIDDLRMSVERGDVAVVGQQSRTGPLVCIPARVWWLYWIEDWETGITNEIGSGDRFFGISFRAALVHRPVSATAAEAPRRSDAAQDGTRASGGSRPGAKPQQDWQALEEAFLRKVSTDGWPEDMTNNDGWRFQADVERWILQTLNNKPSESTARRWAQKWLNTYRGSLGKGQ